MSIQKTLGKNIARLLDEKGWTQADLCEKIGKTSAYLSRVVSGQSWVSAEALDEISGALGVSAHQLLAPSHNRPPKEPRRATTAPIAITEAIRAVNRYDGLISIKIRSNQKRMSAPEAASERKQEVIFTNCEADYRPGFLKAMKKFGFDVTFANFPRESWGLMTMKQYDILIVACNDENRLMNYRHLELMAEYNNAVTRVLIDEKSQVSADVLKVTKPHIVVTRPFTVDKLVEAVIGAYGRAVSKKSKI